jgi:hypothetical protein
VAGLRAAIGAQVYVCTCACSSTTCAGMMLHVRQHLHAYTHIHTQHTHTIHWNHATRNTTLANTHTHRRWRQRASSCRSVRRSWQRRLPRWTRLLGSAASSSSRALRARPRSQVCARALCVPACVVVG